MFRIVPKNIFTISTSRTRDLIVHSYKGALPGSLTPSISHYTSFHCRVLLTVWYRIPRRTGQRSRTFRSELSGCHLNCSDWLLYNCGNLHDSHYLRFRTEAAALAAIRARCDTRNQEHDDRDHYTGNCSVVRCATVFLGCGAAITTTPLISSV